ncbi:hypothetical protein HID58_095968 [Brassica napus]|uniref:Uncharacterized protein n=1 Tax=Brassica napus TaxID=3708 RepID=A0ABQ7X477_BRANA|nr:hypothetical protein HID58_095968 [Brassica napus]
MNTFQPPPPLVMPGYNHLLGTEDISALFFNVITRLGTCASHHFIIDGLDDETIQSYPKILYSEQSKFNNVVVLSNMLGRLQGE